MTRGTGLLDSLPERHLETFYRKKRIAAGVAPKDILAGLKSADECITWLIDQASAEHPEMGPQLKRVGQQYMLMTHMTAISIRSYQP